MATPVPITARLHYNDETKVFRLVARRLDPRAGGTFSVNDFVELVLKFGTLVELIAALVDFFAGLSPTGGAAPESSVVGDWGALADYAAKRAGGTYTPAH